jgi:DNA-binding transcriptional ArsR family regulator
MIVYLANLTCERSDTRYGRAMKGKRSAKYAARAKIIKALAHPARLLIVDELAEQGERCVCELTEVIGSDMSTVSRHLAQLKEAGIIEDEKRGKMIFYRLRVKCLPSFFDCIESVIRCNVASQQALLR